MDLGDSLKVRCSRKSHADLCGGCCEAKEMLALPQLIYGDQSCETRQQAFVTSITWRCWVVIGWYPATIVSDFFASHRTSLFSFQGRRSQLQEPYASSERGHRVRANAAGQTPRRIRGRRSRGSHGSLHGLSESNSRLHANGIWRNLRQMKRVHSDTATGLESNPAPLDLKGVRAVVARNECCSISRSFCAWPTNTRASSTGSNAAC